MKKVLDIDGSIVRGAIKTPTGSISFNDKAALSVYQRKREIALDQQREVADLKEQVIQLMEIVKTLGKQNNG